jgi:hypothetical protein
VSFSQSALVLGAGGGFDYGLGATWVFGTRVRYEHVFLSLDPLDNMRVEARLQWKL